MQRVLVTGSSGFVGESVLKTLKAQGVSVIAHSRNSTCEADENFHADLLPTTNWMPALLSVDVVVHCAARVHQMNETQADAKAAYQSVNVDGTLNLAKQAAANGVKRFVFISSIKVNGEWSEDNTPFSADDVPQPQDEYGRSKWQAEQQLRTLANETGMELVIIRPPLVYGPGVKANFLSMMNWVKKGMPLPLGGIKSKRSLIYVDNLSDLIVTCCKHPKAPGHTFLASDNQDVSLSDLLRRLASILGSRLWLLPVPQSVLILLLSGLGKKAVAQRLCKPLQLDIQPTIKTLSWKPKYSMNDGLKATANEFMKERNNR